MPETATGLGLAFVIADVTVVAVFGIRVLLQRHPVGATFAWLTILLVVPFVGAALYLLIGERRLGSHRARRAAAVVEVAHHWLRGLRARFNGVAETLPIELRPLERQASNVVGIPALPGNELVLFQDAYDVLVGIAGDLEAARRSVFLEFYIWHPGGAADAIVDALARAAGRGVECRVLLDDVGSARFLADARCKRLRAAGVQIVAALPVGFLRALFRRIDLRNHRKLAVIDGDIAWTGSQNLVDPALFKQDVGVGKWIDAAVRGRGPSVEALSAAFVADWELETGRGRELLDAGAVPRPSPIHGSAAVQVVPSGPGYTPEALHEVLLTTIYAAREELVLTTPYFVPDDAMLAALVSAAHRGVSVTVVVPERVDSIMVRYASRSHFETLLAAGVRVLEYADGLLHSKTITVDESLCLIGSINLDMRSLWLNFELTLLVYDDGFAGEVRAMQRGYRERARPLELESWRARPVTRRLLERVFQLVGPLL